MLQVLLHAAARGAFTEELLLRPLGSGRTLAHFSFAIEEALPRELGSSVSVHYRLAPRVVGELVRAAAVRELEFSVAQGKWRQSEWGPAGLRSEVPCGSALWAWTDGANASASVDDARWEHVVRGFAGAMSVGLAQLVDGALNADAHAATMRSPFAFDARSEHAAAGARFRRGASAVDAACVDNLRPFLKLLPCEGRAGLAARLTSGAFVGASHRSLRVHARREPSGTLTLVLEAQLVLDNADGAEGDSWTLDALLPRRRSSSSHGSGGDDDGYAAAAAGEACALAQYSTL
jgi:phosphatidylinositol glycan class T